MGSRDYQLEPKPKDKLDPSLISLIDLHKLEDCSDPTPKPRKSKEIKKAEASDVVLESLHSADIELIKLIRSIEFGEIDSLKIQNGLPVTYKMAWKSGKFV